jgi:membrane peptidoglycan carboxypeptidase
MANLMCIIANKGFFYTPHFVERIDGLGSEDTILQRFKTKHAVTRIPIAAYEAVQLGMQDVVDHGTAWMARIDGITMAAKTGTAENYGIINGKREKLEDHSWFVCFAPRENPKIAVAVVVENAGFGATWAGPRASLIVEKYLNDTLRPHRLKEVDRIASKEIILPVIRQKRQRLDSIRRTRMEAIERSVTNRRENIDGRFRTGNIPGRSEPTTSGVRARYLSIKTGQPPQPEEKRRPIGDHPSHQAATIRKDEGTKS